MHALSHAIPWSRTHNPPCRPTLCPVDLGCKDQCGPRARRPSWGTCKGRIWHCTKRASRATAHVQATRRGDTWSCRTIHGDIDANKHKIYQVCREPTSAERLGEAPRFKEDGRAGNRVDPSKMLRRSGGAPHRPRRLANPLLVRLLGRHEHVGADSAGRHLPPHSLFAEAAIKRSATCFSKEKTPVCP